MKANPESYAENFTLLADLISNTQGIAFFLLPLCTVVSAGSKMLMEQLVPSQVEITVKALLDDFREAAFPSDDPDVAHRVTLFRHKYFSWYCITQGRLPWGGWLVPYERSGHFNLKSTARFRVNMSDSSTAEGFAGRVFTEGNCLYLTNLPALTADASPSNLKKYAKATHVDENWIRARIKRNNHWPRCLWGIHIEVNGKRWGVVIIDSTHRELEGREALKSHYRHIGLCLSNLFRKK